MQPQTGSGDLCAASSARRSCFAASSSSSFRSCRLRRAVRAVSAAQAKPPVQKRIRIHQIQCIAIYLPLCPPAYRRTVFHLRPGPFA